MSMLPDSNSESDLPAAWESRILAVLVAFTLLRAWLMPLGSSLWLDETATWWVAAAGTGSVWERAASWLAQSPAYGLVVALSLSLLGDSEVALRVPSLLAMMLSAWLFARLATRLDGFATARISAVLFLSHPDIAFMACDARPYAIALATFLGSTLFLARWIQGRRAPDLLAWTGLAALVPAFHPLLALGWIWSAPFTLLILARERPRSRRALIEACSGWFVAALSLLFHITALSSNAARLSFASSPSLDELAAYLAEPATVAGIVTALCFALLSGLPLGLEPTAPRTKVTVIALAWWLLPALFAFLVARGTSAKIFVDRYLLVSVPGAALLLGAFASRLRSARVRAVLTAAIVIWSVGLATGGSLWPAHGDQDWRGALTYAHGVASDSGTLVCVASGFVEATGFSGKLEPASPGPLHAPVARYGRGLKIVPLPYWPDDTVLSEIDTALGEHGTENRILLIELRFQPFTSWFRGRLAAMGFARAETRTFGGVSATLFLRTAP